MITLSSSNQKHLELSGDLSFSNFFVETSRLKSQLSPSVDSIDLSGLRVKDSTGVCFVLFLMRNVRRRVMFHGMSSSLKSLIALYGLDEFITQASE